MRLRSRLVPRLVSSCCGAGRFFISSLSTISSSRRLVILSSPLVSSPVSDIAWRGASRPVPRLVPRLGLVSDEARRWGSSSYLAVPVRGHLGPVPSHHVSFVVSVSRVVWRLASLRSRAVSSDEGQASKTARASRLGLAVPSRHPCGGRVVPVVLVAFPVASSSPHPHIHGKQASGGRTGRPRGVGGGGLFLSSSGEKAGRDTIPSGGVASFRWAAMISFGGRHASSFPRRSPVRAPSPHPFPYRKNLASKQAMGMAGRFRRSYPGGWNGGQARRERRTASPRFISSNGPTTTTRVSSHTVINTIAPPRRQARTRRTDETPGERRNENARPSKTASKQRDDGRDAQQQDGGRDETQAARAKASKNGRREHEKREEQNAPFSNLSPDPLPPSLPNPRASIIPPPPVVG